MASINEHVDKIAVNGDSRIRRESTMINGRTYGMRLSGAKATRLPY
jgi:hypothetical protein